MKLVICLLLLFSSNFLAQENYTKRIMAERLKKDSLYADTATSPLSLDQVRNFNGLSYFEPDENYKVNCVFIKKIGKVFDMATSNGTVKKFRRYGFLKFSIKGQKFKLPIYQNMKLLAMPIYKNYIFIPFTDLTNNESTYAGGRFIESTLPNSKHYVLDFNLCFNPYCHYTDGYACPIPPIENHLNIKIEAGEKRFANALH